MRIIKRCHIDLLNSYTISLSPLFGFFFLFFRFINTLLRLLPYNNSIKTALTAAVEMTAQQREHLKSYENQQFNHDFNSGGGAYRLRF